MSITQANRYRTFSSLSALEETGLCWNLSLILGSLEIPILGINTGRLGFLATISKSETEEALQKIFEGSFTLDKRAAAKTRDK